MLIFVLLSAFIVAAVWGHAAIRANAARRDHEFYEALEDFQARRANLAVQEVEPQAKKARRRSPPVGRASTRKLA